MLAQRSWKVLSIRIGLLPLHFRNGICDRRSTHRDRLDRTVRRPAATEKHIAENVKLGDLKALGVADNRGPDASRDSHDQRHAEARGLCSRAITHAEQQAIEANIFVQALPMQSAAASADDVGLALFIIRLEKPREVCEWDRKLATIRKKHPQIVRVEP